MKSIALLLALCIVFPYGKAIGNDENLRKAHVGSNLKLDGTEMLAGNGPQKHPAVSPKHLKEALSKLGNGPSTVSKNNPTSDQLSPGRIDTDLRRVREKLGGNLDSFTVPITGPSRDKSSSISPNHQQASFSKRDEGGPLTVSLNDNVNQKLSQAGIEADLRRVREKLSEKSDTFTLQLNPQQSGSLSKLRRQLSGPMTVPHTGPLTGGHYAHLETSPMKMAIPMTA